MLSFRLRMPHERKSADPPHSCRLVIGTRTTLPTRIDGIWPRAHQIVDATAADPNGFCCFGRSMENGDKCYDIMLLRRY